MPIIPVTIPATAPWKPSKAQVVAAAMAYARVDESGWRRLEPSQRDDYLIDAAAALVAAHRVMPLAVAHTSLTGGEDLVCMTKEHADAYAELFAATDDVESRPVLFLCDQRTPCLARLRAAVARLRSLASPESTTR